MNFISSGSWFYRKHGTNYATYFLGVIHLIPLIDQSSENTVTPVLAARRRMQAISTFKSREGQGVDGTGVLS